MIQIEKHDVDEPKALLEFAKKNFIETYAHLNTVENMKAYLSEHFTPQAFFVAYHHPETTYLIARHEDEIVGYIKANIGSVQTEHNHPNGCEIERIYVASDHKGRGIGKKLFQAALDYARELNKSYLWLGVWEENLDALRFYKKIGMKQFGSHIFQLGDDAQQDILMRFDLSTPD